MAVWAGANKLSSTVANDSILLSVVGKFPELKVRQPCRLETGPCSFANGGLHISQVSIRLIFLIELKI